MMQAYMREYFKKVYKSDLFIELICDYYSPNHPMTVKLGHCQANHFAPVSVSRSSWCACQRDTLQESDNPGRQSFRGGALAAMYTAK